MKSLIHICLSLLHNEVEVDQVPGSVIEKQQVNVNLSLDTNYGKTATHLFSKAGLFICCKGKKLK